MRGASATMEVLRPRSAREAVSAFAHRPQAIPLAGGTDFMVAWNAGQLNGKEVLDISGVGEWTGIRKVDGGLLVGSLVTHSQLQQHPMVRREFPLLALACATVGAVQIQNRGTLGGNIANASPAGDTFPPLAVYEPMVRAVSETGRRSIPFSEIFAGVKKTILRPAELIEAVEIPYLSRSPSRGIFRKVGTRAAQAVSKTVASGLLWLAGDGAVSELRFALGSMAPTVRRLRTAESFLRGRKLTTDVIEQAVGLLESDVSPIDDVRSTREYRLQASRNLLRSFLEPRK